MYKIVDMLKMLAFAGMVANVFGAAPPNIVVMLSDDFGWGSIGYNQPTSLPPRARTPNLDSMANSANGVRFDRFYAGGPVCSPTRASIYTGRTPNRDCIFTAYVSHMSPENEDTVTQIAARNGYRTFHAGKYHLGDISGHNCEIPAYLPGNPGDFEVDTWYAASGSGPSATYNCWTLTSGKACAGGAENYSGDMYNNCLLNYLTTPAGKGGPGNPVLNETVPQTINDGRNGSDGGLIVDKFSSFLETVDAKDPFAAMVWFHSPHLPHNADPMWVDAYKNDSSLDALHIDYYGTISDVDAQVGRIRDMLRLKGVADNTMLWFLSDNGCERQQPGNEALRPNGKARITGCKRWLREGGIRVPGILEWPAVITENRRISTPVVSMDILPTFLDAAGFDRRNPSWPLDGQSILPILRGDTDTRDPIGFATELKKLPGDEVNDCFPVGGRTDFDQLENIRAQVLRNTVPSSPGDPSGFARQYQLAWMDGDLKLWGSGNGGYRSADFQFFLYNITADPIESIDLSKQLPEQRAKMLLALDKWYNSTVNSTMYETKCLSAPPPNPTPSTNCTFYENQGLSGDSIGDVPADSADLCCGICIATNGCAAADWNTLADGTYMCHLRNTYDPKSRNDGSVAVVPK